MHNKKICTVEDIPDHGENLLVADEDKPNLKLNNATLKRCLFIRLGLKNAQFQKVNFHQCVFEDCYFRKSTFYDVEFTGSFFKDCNLERASFEATRFWYVRFLRCRLNYNEILQCIPSEPNIAISLLRSLRQNAIQMGQKQIADTLLEREIEAQKHELKNRFLGVSAYYKRRYDSVDRLISAGKFVGLVLSGWIWGHGLRLRNLLISAFVLIFVFGLLFSQFGMFRHDTSESIYLGFWKSVYLSVATFTTLGYSEYGPGSAFTYIAYGIESFLGVVFLGFLAASVYRKFSK